MWLLLRVRHSKCMHSMDEVDRYGGMIGAVRVVRFVVVTYDTLIDVWSQDRQIIK